MVLFVSCCTLIILTATLPSSHGTVCSYSCSRSYRQSCGLFGWQRCIRYRQATCNRCCDGWTGSAESGCNTPVCSPSCPNGGTCTSPNHCSNCDRGYYSPSCNACTSIANCLDVYCSSSTNHRCAQCDGDYGPSLGSAYKRSSDQRQCIKQCSWRVDSNACYPGTCTDGACTCSSGFSGADCRTMASSQAPVISEHRATLTEGETTLVSPAVQGSTVTVYTDKTNFTSMHVHWRTYYQPTGLPDITAGGHPYIQSVRLGVVSTRVRATVHLADGGTYYIGSQDCAAAGSQDSPRTDLVICESNFNIDYSAWTPATGDVLKYDIESVSGGYLKLYDRDMFNRIITRYYIGRTVRAHSTFTYALDGPYHCVNVINECRASMLNAGSDVTTQPEITVTWDGWDSEHAGIKDYRLQVRQLSGSQGDELTEIFDLPAVYDNVTESGVNVTLPDIGVYSIVLTVTDNVDNVRLSRRFVFFDDDPNDVTIQSDSPLRVLSATEETGNLWLTNADTAGGTTPMTLDWRGHFINERHRSQGLLRPIGNYPRAVIDVDYDQYFGRRGRVAIPNALGVTEFRVFYDIDHSGGRTIVNASNGNSDYWRNKAAGTRSTFHLTLQDGDSIRFWVEARDIASHFVRDSVLIHVDSSPPVIEDLRLVVELSDISVEFKTFDIHSGVKTIEWRLFDNSTGAGEEFRNGTVAVDTDEETESCNSVNCMCVPLGGCYVAAYGFKPTIPTGMKDRDYYIELTVVNYAGLVTNETIKAMVTAENVAQVAESLVSLTNATSSIDDNAVAVTADILESIVDIQDTSPEVTASVLMVVDNLLQVDDEQFSMTDTVSNSSSRVVKALEKQISNVLAAGGNVTQVTSRLAVVAMNFPPSSLDSGVGFAAATGENDTDSFTEDQIDVYAGEESEIPDEQVAASIELPAEIQDKFEAGGSVPVSFIVYQNSKLFRSQQTRDPQSTNSPGYVASWIVSATVEGARIENLPADSRVVSTFLQSQDRSSDRGDETDQETTECVFWDFSLQDGIGDWSTKGCETGPSVSGRTVCQCDHATNFAVLVSIHGPKYASFALDVISKIGCGISIVALIITIFVYAAIRSLRTATAGRILISFCVSLLCLYLVFVAGVDQTASRVGCIIAAVLMHYFALTSMAWMGVKAANLYLKLVKVFNSEVEHFMIKASLAAWGLPLFVVVVVLAVDYTVYDNGHSCFLKPGAAFYYGQLLILGLLLLFNAVIFVLVLRKLTCSANKLEDRSDERKRGKIKQRLQNMASISVLLGLTWAFGLLSVFDSTSLAFQALFCVFNSLQGLFIFLLFVARQQKIRGHLIDLVRGRQAKFLTSSTSTGRLTTSSMKTVESTVRAEEDPGFQELVADSEYEDMAAGTGNDRSGFAGGNATAETPFNTRVNRVDPPSILYEAMDPDEDMAAGAVKDGFGSSRGKATAEPPFNSPVNRIDTPSVLYEGMDAEENDYSTFD